MDFLETDKKNIWHPFSSLVDKIPVLGIARGEGASLYTTDGKEIIDAISSWWVNLHGHGNPDIARAIYEQALQLEHVIFSGFTHEPAALISDSLLSHFGGEYARAFFSDNGSTAVEVAIKIAVQHFHNQGKIRQKIIALEGAYHGDTFGSMSVTHRSPFNASFEKMLFDVEFIPFPHKGHEEKCLQAMSEALKKEGLAAFIFEPLIQGAAGMRMYEAGVLEKLMSMAKQKGVLTIADEVFTGFGRTGKMFASDHLNTKADLICLSKGLTGGFMPLGLTLCSPFAVAPFMSSDKLKTFFHGHSYTANPLACAAANASWNILNSPECQANMKAIEKENTDFVVKMSDHHNILRIESLGTILAVEMKTKNESGYFNEERDNLYNYFINKGILLRPLGNVIYVVPPYVIGLQKLRSVHNAISDFLNR